MRAARLPIGALLLGLLPGTVARADRLQEVERQFRAALEGVTPMTVMCVPRDVPEGKQPGLSSGVIVSRSGLVLSDGDPGALLDERGALAGYADVVEIRVPDLERGGYSVYRAEVVRRVRGVDTTLLRILDAPSGGFREALAPASSDDLRVGDFAFTVGNAFGLSGEAPPTLTAGVVASVAPLPEGDPGGRLEVVYTSAAVNPGVNGGPVLDGAGRLVGTVSTFLGPAPDEPHQFLGKVIPMDRIRAAFADLPQAEEVFGRARERSGTGGATRALEDVFHHTARRAGARVVSLAVEREQPISTAFPGPGGRTFEVPRYLGPVSGILLDEEGWIVTSLYNLTNVGTLVMAGWAAPPEHQYETGLRSITGATVHLPGGGRASARLAGHDGRAGLALFKADLSAVEGLLPDLPPLVAVPEEDLAEGRFVLALGNPYGARAHPDPLLTIGILAKRHEDDAPEAWRGQWQTDAGATDANCGGAVVDLRGRLVGMLHIWTPPRHGRNSGIAFVVPWADVAAALGPLKEGRSRARGYLGIRFGDDPADAAIAEVIPGTPAHAAGLEPGDRIEAVNGRPTPTSRHVLLHLGVRWEGEAVRLEIRRGEEALEVEIVLAPRT